MRPSDRKRKLNTISAAIKKAMSALPMWVGNASAKDGLAQ
jgi:hypothetical protein